MVVSFRENTGLLGGGMGIAQYSVRDASEFVRGVIGSVQRSGEDTVMSRAQRDER